MRLPLSAKTLIRLHRNIFMLRRPRALARNAYCLTLTPGKKTPTLSLQVTRNRPHMIGIALAIGVFALTAWLSSKE
jgi:hypothetical protein